VLIQPFSTDVRRPDLKSGRLHITIKSQGLS